MRVIAVALCVLAGVPAQAQQTLEQLLDEVRQNREQVSADVAARLNQFRQQRDQQEQMLEEVRAQLEAARRRSEELSRQFDNNELQLAQTEQNLELHTGDMQEVFGIVRQFAGDAIAIFRNSLISAQLGDRTALLRELSEAKNVPPPQQLRDFHLLMLEHMAESGKVVRFNAPVVTAAGEPANADIVRVGTFNLIADDSFLRYNAATGTIQVLPRQPASRHRADAAALASATGGVIPMAVDPSQGALLGLLIQAPSVRERIEQGGVVGYIIIALGVLGLLIGLSRLLYLGIAGAGIRRQLASTEARPGNALGRVLAVYEHYPHVETETLELKLDEAIMKETPRLERWQIAIKVIAAVAPLLGLLGTVIGMIQTFQSITLFGTGDPKLMASGISQALVTTMLGLLVAIPMVLLHSLLASRSKQLIEILEEQSAGIVAEQAEKDL